MRCEKFTYAEVETCLYEATRALIKGGKVLAERESKALIDTTLSGLNKVYIHDCLKPLETPPKKRNGKLYITNEEGREVEYIRGLTIANYHDSQLSSNYGKARMTGTDDQLSKAMGFIITLPKDYIESAIPDLTNDEYEYYVEKSEAEAVHKSFEKNPELEASLSEKFKKHEWTKEEMEKAKEFLLAAKDCTLEEMGIRNEDVLFHSIHFDESFPHIHCMALPTKEKIYEEDVYSKKKKKDGTYSLLHKKGDKAISYSISRFYEEKTEEGEYKFFKDLHPNVVKRMDEKGFDASGLINGSTKGKGFSVKQMSKEQRQASVDLDTRARVLEKTLKEKDEEIEKKNKALEEKDSLLQEKDSLLEEKDAELERLRAELNYKENQVKDTDAILDMNNQLIVQTDKQIDEQNAKLEEMAGSYTTLSVAVEQKKKDKALYEELAESAKKGYEDTYKGQEEEFNAFNDYKANKGKYEAKQARLEVQVAKLEGQKEDLKDTVKDLCKEVGDTGFITRAIHNISNTEKEIQNYDDMMLFVRIATNFLERKFPKILQDIMTLIQQAKGIGSRKSVIKAMKKEAEEMVSNIEEEWEKEM